MARKGRPWRDFKPPPSAPVWAIIQGVGSYWTLVAAIDLGVFDGVEQARSDHDRAVGGAPRRIGAAPAARVRCAGQLRVPRPGRRGVRADRDGRALPVHRRSGFDGRVGAGRPRTVAQLGVAGRHGANRRGRRRQSRTILLRSTDRSSPRRSLPSCAPQVDWVCGSAGRGDRDCVCSTSERDARRGRSPSSSNHPAARPSSTILLGSSSWPRRRLTERGLS